MKGSEYLHSNVKRSLDLAIVGGALPLSSPIFTAMYLYNHQRGEPLLFKQERVGQNNRRFDLLKLETLSTGAEKDGLHLKRLRLNQREKEIEDSRAPNKVMRLMRISGLNELPQLINVVRGEMSIVGPRAQIPEYIAIAEELFPEVVYRWRETAMTIRPGLVGVSPLITRGLSVNLFDKTALADIRYYHEATLGKDLKIIAQAIFGIFRSIK